MSFATSMHHGQVYPSGRGLPYICHPALVCMVVVAALLEEPADDPDLAVQCALLHDTLEDTRATYPLIEHTFGRKVAEGVLAMTKDPLLPKEARLAESLRRIQLQPREVGMVKLADRICNLGKPPSDWTEDRKMAYFADAKEIGRVLGFASPLLSGLLERRMQAYLNNEWA